MNTRAILTWLRTLGLCVLVVVLTACSTGRGKGGYYQDDGPHANPPSNLDKVPDAIPKIEPLASGPNKPYSIFGRHYVPDTSGKPYRAKGLASWYGRKFHGNSTSNGERYDMYAMTAAHPTLPIPSYVRVTRVANGKTVILRINDRGPFHSDRVIDLSYVAAYKLGILGPGSAEVIVERIMPDEIRNWSRIAAQPETSVVPDTAAGFSLVNSTDQAIATTQAVAPPPSAPQARPLPASTAPSITTSPAESNSSTGVALVYLQMGAFGDPANARSLADRLSQQAASLNSKVSIDQHANQLYRVRIGPFASREAALEAAEPLRAATGISPAISLP
jgi:rare lipoprotein A